MKLNRKNPQLSLRKASEYGSSKHFVDWWWAGGARRLEKKYIWLSSEQGFGKKKPAPN